MREQKIANARRQEFMKSDNAAQIFITGGTFDKDYNFITGELYFKDTHLQDMLDRGRCTMPVDIKTLMMIDSLAMGDAERKIIEYNCRQTLYENIVVTHGTDTMTETAQHLKRAEMKNKTIVLTGAMIPYAFGSSSDGFFNLGSALAFAQVLDPGVYVCMNGQYWDADLAFKNRSTGYFQIKG
ncbi:MAG: L-asparaginase [Saprospiraceae bacterium]